MVLEILFWILLILSVLSAFLPDDRPYTIKSRYAVVLILIAILGIKLFAASLFK